MKPMRLITMALLSISAAAALASEAETSATAGSQRNQRNGTAAATARYEGQVGFARTNTSSGQLNLARGVAVGVDHDGLSLSVSQALATRLGPAVATNFNLSIGRDGQVSASAGRSVADGAIHQSATAGGQAGTGRQQSASSWASGRTDRYGSVQASTQAYDYSRPRLTPLRRVQQPQRSPVKQVRILRLGRRP